MTWFKKVALAVVKGFQVGEKIVVNFLEPLLPVVQQLDPSAAPIIAKAQTELQRIFQVIHDAQVMSAALELQPGSGPMRLKAAAPVLAGELFNMIDTIGLKVADPAAAQAATVALTSGFADFLNALEPK